MAPGRTDERSGPTKNPVLPRTGAVEWCEQIPRPLPPKDCWKRSTDRSTDLGIVLLAQPSHPGYGTVAFSGFRPPSQWRRDREGFSPSSLFAAHMGIRRETKCPTFYTTSQESCQYVFSSTLEPVGKPTSGSISTSSGRAQPASFMTPNDLFAPLSRNFFPTRDGRERLFTRSSSREALVRYLPKH